MMRKSTVIASLIVLVVVIVGGYALIHKSNKPVSSAQTKTTSSAAAVNNSVLITKTSPSLGQYLATPDGKALYTYRKDTANTSNCTGSCISSWPAYQSKGPSTNLPSGVGTIKRSDNGETQYTYNEMPLYTFVGDSNGQATGNGIADFEIEKPAAAHTAPAAHQSSSASSTTTANSSSSSNW